MSASFFHLSIYLFIHLFNITSLVSQPWHMSSLSAQVFFFFFPLHAFHSQSECFAIKFSHLAGQHYLTCAVLIDKETTETIPLLVPRRLGKSHDLVFLSRTLAGPHGGGDVHPLPPVFTSLSAICSQSGSLIGDKTLSSCGADSLWEVILGKRSWRNC